MLSFLSAYRSKCHFHLLFFYSSFSLFFRHFIPFFFSPLSFFLRHCHQPISSFTLFSSHCYGVSLFCSASSISVAMGFFFFFAVIWWVASAVGGFSLPFSLAVPFDADLCVFCCCFCFSVVVVLVSCYGGSIVRRWWGVDGWVGRRWMG